MRIRYKKTNDKVITPNRANPSDAGLDVYYSGSEIIYIDPLQNYIVPTGLIFEVPHGYYLDASNRGSMAGKRSLITGAHVIDSGYSGEVFIDLHNIGLQVQMIEPGQKIAQLVMLPVISFIPEEVSFSTEFYNTPMTISNRGEGSLGSTGG